MLSHNITIGGNARANAFVLQHVMPVSRLAGTGANADRRGHSGRRGTMYWCAVCQFICPQEAIRGVNSPYVIFAITPWSHLSPLLRRRWRTFAMA